jgi:seryl-tRNA synthetase
VIPNMPAADVPVGKDATFNKKLRAFGKIPEFGFTPKQHFEIGEALGLMDFETAAKLSGSRFVVLKGPLARLERALSQFMLDLHTSEHGYTEINPPLLVRDDTMFGTAQLPKFAEDQFKARARITIEPDEFRITIGNEPGTVSFEFLGERKQELQRRFSIQGLSKAL